ncbi:MAG: CehA/McbA family metallohydrolase [Planctomycetes bacterium]|nr:CehA/McbA family metallohydrolase [Planctomycetota bacterium]
MEITGFFVAAPSTVNVGEEFSIGVKVLCTPYFVGAKCNWRHRAPCVAGPYNLSPRGITYMDNVPPDWRGTIRIEGDGGYAGPTELSFENVSGLYEDDNRPITRIHGLKFSRPGTKFITIRDPRSGVAARSNPIVVSAAALDERIYWGDLHSQTFFSDGLRCPEELYSFARDEAFLDIFAISDHTEPLTDRQWDYFVNVTNDFNTPGEYVTLVGLEWTNSKIGHRNVYYPGSAGPILRSNDPTQSSLDEVYRVAQREGALVIPHHSANVTMGVNWDLGHDPEVERLVEIYSIWGNSERSASAGNTRPIRTSKGERDGQHVLDALGRGYRFGFIGGGDIHDGRPGDELHSRQNPPEQYPLLWRQGIMGVWAPKLTREAIFEALWNRRVFATTNVRMFLTFHVCGQPMGSETTHSGPRSIEVHAASEVPIAKVEIVKNGHDAFVTEPGECEVQWAEEDPDADSEAWYYVRVTRTDGEMAWSSPVWVATE